MLPGLGDSHGGQVCVPGASGVAGLEVFLKYFQWGLCGLSCTALKLAVACSLALGMLMVDMFVSLEHPVWQV